MNEIKVIVPSDWRLLVYTLEQIGLKVYEIFVFTPKKSKLKILPKKIACPKRTFSENYLSNRQAGRVLAKSLPVRLSKGNSMNEWDKGHCTI